MRDCLKFHSLQQNESSKLSCGIQNILIALNINYLKVLNFNFTCLETYVETTNTWEREHFILCTLKKYKCLLIKSISKCISILYN